MPYEVEFDGKEKDFSPIPTGEYVAYVHTIKEKSNDTGPYLSVRFNLSEDNDKHKGRTVFTNCFLEGAAAFRTKELLVACGVARKGDIAKVSFEPRDLEGKKVKLQIGIREYNGMEQNDIKRILPFGGTATTGGRAAAGANPRSL